MTRERVRLPVVVSRWFEYGHGYAHGPDLDPDSLDGVIGTLQALSGLPDGTDHAVALPDGRRVIVTREADDSPLDPKAAGRPAHVIRAAVCPRWATAADETEVRDRLAGLELPDRPGRAPGLAVYLYCPPPDPPVPRPRITDRAAWLLVPATAAIEVALRLVAVETDWTAAGLRVAAMTALVFLACSVGKPWPNGRVLRALEGQWYPGARPVPKTAGLVGLHARLILLDGRPPDSPAEEAPIEALPVRRDPDRPLVNYDPIVFARAGRVVLTGREHLITGDGSVLVAFTRTYVWRRRWWFWRGTWQLSYAQWTRLV